MRILLAEDHRIVREGLRSLLEGQTGFEVVAEAGDGLEAVRAARASAPDVAVVALSMPGMNGIEATRRLVAESPGIRVLCLSTHAEERYITAALAAGAHGYLIKDCAFDELVLALRTVASGQTYLSPAISGVLVDAYTARVDDRGAGDVYPFRRLSGREREVLQLIAEGHSSKQIAARLRVSVKTIGTHRERLMEKLDIHHVAGLVKYAIRRGLTTAEA